MFRGRNAARCARGRRAGSLLGEHRRGRSAAGSRRGAFNVAAALVAHEAGVFPHPPRARTRLAGGTWLTFSAARVDGNRAPDERDIAVAVTASTPAERRALYVRAHGLTPREREVVDRLADGRDTSAIADALFVSEHTVQDHLKSVFAKTGARYRRTLLARANGR